MPQPIDINTASRAELVKLRGVGGAIADRIIAHRGRIEGFDSVDDLEHVVGLSDATIAGIRGDVTVGPAKPPDAPGVVTVVFDADGADGDYAGYSIVTTGKRVDDDGDVVPFAVNTPAAEAGRTAVGITGRDRLIETIRFDVLSAAGVRMARVERDAKDLPDRLQIPVAPRDVAATQPNEDPAAGKPTRLRGRVIDEAGRQIDADVQVVIWAARVDDPDDADFTALVVASTDATGHFTGPYPIGSFTAAHAAVSVGDEPQNVTIHLQSEPNAGEFPESVILVVDLPDVDPLDHDDQDDHDDDCACHTGTTPPRSPDGTDLARADGTFSSDLGTGRCVDFTKPDRTLEEFTYSYAVRTTEPEIKGFTLDEPPKIDIGRVRELYGRLPAKHLMMSTAAPALTDARAVGGGSAPTATAAALVAEPFDAKSLEGMQIDARVLKTLTRDPDGFSLTNLFRSAERSTHLDLQRLLGRTIVKNPPSRERLSCRNLIDWDDEPTIYQACTIAHGHLLRFKQEWVADGYSMGNLLYSLPLAPGQQKQMSIVDWERRESSTRREQLDATESLDASLERDRDISEVVRGALSESTRGGSSASGGGIAAGGGIGGILGSFGGLLGIGGGYSSASGSAWQNSSRKTSASALNQLRDRTTQSASAVRSQRSSVVQSVRQGERVEATTESVANYNHCHAITIQYFEVLRHLLVRQRLTDVQECLFVPLMMSWFTSDKALRWRDTMFRSVPRQLRRGFGALDRIANDYEGSDLPTGRYADDQLLSVDGELRMRFQIARPRDDEDGEFQLSAWQGLLTLFGFSPQDFYEQHLKNEQFKDQVFLEELGPEIASTVVSRLKIEALKTDGTTVDLKVDPTLISTFRNDRELYVTLRMGDDFDPVDRADIKAVVINSRLQFPGLPLIIDALPAGSRVVVESGAMRYRTAHHADHLFRSRRIDNDLTAFDDVRIETPLNRRELRNPREEDRENSRRLLDYLNEHIERFHHVIWSRMSDDRRYMLLDGFEAPNAGGRSVASVVENELIGIVGNCLVMPVARGYHLDPTFNQDDDKPIDLLEHYEPNTPLEPSRVALPTRGVYAEAVMGACNSCEVKDEARFWRWEESPIPDSPPAIGATSTDSRRADPPSLDAKNFPAPIIAMQQAPTAPDPTGLGGVLTLLGQSGIFPDMAGLAGTQANAAAALDGAFKTATTFGTKAADLALQGAMVKDVDKAMRTIQNAKSQGLIDDKQASELTESAIRGLVGAGTTNPPKTTTTEEVKDLTKTAGDNNAAVKVSRPTGEQVEVDAKADGDEAGNAIVDALAELLGLGSSGKPKARPDRAVDLPKAVAKIAAFKTSSATSVWTNLDRADVADGLLTLVNDPDKVNQGSIGVCGPAVFFNIWIEADPIAFVDFAISMHHTGEARIGSLEVEAGSDLRAQDYKVLAGKMNPVVPPADWMVMSALRDSENGFFDFEGTPQEDFSGGTSGSEIASWLRATGLFKRVADDTATVLGEDFAHAAKLNPTANRKIVMFMDTNMILSARAKGKGRHFVTLRSKVTKLANDHVDFRYWTWGSPPASVAQPLTEDRFDDTYLGAVVAEF